MHIDILTRVYSQYIILILSFVLDQTQDVFPVIRKYFYYVVHLLSLICIHGLYFHLFSFQNTVIFLSILLAQKKFVIFFNANKRELAVFFKIQWFFIEEFHCLYSISLCICLISHLRLSYLHMPLKSNNAIQIHKQLKYPKGSFTKCVSTINIIDLGQDSIFGIIIDSTMGVQKKKIQVKRKIKVLSKREKAHKRVLRVHKAVERKKKERTLKKKQASMHRRKLAANDENQIVQMARPQEQSGNVSDIELGLLEILGFGPDESHADWQNALERKLKEIQEKSLDNPEVRRVYGEIGKIFNRYRSGKVPKAFKIIPNLQRWREVLALTRPNEWTSQAMAQAVNIFASNFDPLRAEEFYKSWLVPSVRRDLANNKKLNVHLYDSLKKALYKTNAWFKGVMFELCDEHTTSKEVKVVQSILSKMSIPVISASVAMLKLMDLPFSSPAIHYLSALLNKHYTLPKRVLTRMTEYLLSFMDYEGELSVAWHCLLLTLAKQYSQSLDEMGKAALADLAKTKNHKLITPEILKHLQ